MILLALIGFVVSLVLGLLVLQVHPKGSAINCGTPLRVIDGDFAEGVPRELRSECQDAASRIIDYMLFPCIGLAAVGILGRVVVSKRGASAR